MRRPRVIGLIALLVLAVSCASGPAAPSTTAPPAPPTTASTAPSTTAPPAPSVPTTLPVDVAAVPGSPEAAAETFINLLRLGDCPAAYEMSGRWMWGPWRDEAIAHCESLMSSTPEISLIRRTEVYLHNDELDPLLGLSGPEAMVVFDVVYATGLSAEWSVSLGHAEAGAWEVDGMTGP